MTVIELIRTLMELDEDLMDAPVQCEGCDCVGPASGVKVVDRSWNDKTPAVLIERSFSDD